NGDIKLQPTLGKLKLELNSGINEIEFEIPYDKEKKWTKVDEWGIIKCKVFYTKNKQLYRIYSTHKGMFGLQCKARHIFFDLIKHTIEDNRAVNATGQSALNKILEGTKYKGHSDIQTLNTAYFVKMNAIAALNGEEENSFRNRWGGEMLYDNFDIYINRRIGGDYGVKIKYANNMEDVNLEIDRDNIITRARPVAYDGKMLPEKYVDSPLINKYPIICEGYIDMNDLKLKDPTNSDDEEGFDTEEELYNAMRKRTKELFNGGLDKAKISGNVKMVALENTLDYKHIKNLVNVGIGDTVKVFHNDIGINLETRCISIEWNLITEKYENIEFGEVEMNYFDKQDIAREQLDNILNSNGSVNSSKMEGVISALKTKFSALRNVAQPQHVLGMLFEDAIKGSETYGAMAIGSMGFMIASERTPDDKDWDWRTFGSGQGFFADWLVGKLKTVLIESMDGKSFWNLETGDFCLNGGRIIGKNGNFEMNLQKEGELSFKNNGKEAIKIHNNAIDLFNWSNDSDYIGSLMSLCKIINGKPDPEKPLIGLTHDNNSSISLGYQKEDGNFSSYMELDKYNILGHAAKAPIKVFEHIEMNDNIIYNPKLKADNALQIYINGSLIATFGEKGLWLNVPIFNKDGHLAFDPMAPQGETVDGSDELRNKIVNSARKLIGKWYVYGGNFSPLGNDSGTDCSGLMQWAYNDNGIKISRTTYTQIKEGTEVSEGDLKPGDLVFPSTEHVFMYSGESNGRHMCVEAAHTGTQIRERAFSWGSGYRARRIIKE
ncbi:MAG: phage tail spike protein, partial [Proteocatella sp.]